MTTTTSSVHSVKEVIGEDREPGNYEGYLYRYTVNDPSGPDGLVGRWYVGSHLGYLDDCYHQSSTDKEFNEIFRNPNANITLEYLKFGDHNMMTAKEHNYLKGEDAINNPMSFNKSLGSPQIHEIDYARVNDLVEQINDGDFEDFNDVSVNELFELPRLQVRDEDDSKHINKIRDRIDDAGGSTAKCNPVTILQGRGKDNADVVMDGNHTIQAAYKSPRARTLRRNIIPLDVHSLYTNPELRAAALLLNPIKEFETKSTDEADAVKYVVGLWSKGMAWKTPSTRQFLGSKEKGGLGFGSKAVSRIMEKAGFRIDDLEAAQANKLWKDYKTPRFEPELDEEVLKHTNDDTVVLGPYTSGAFDWRKIVDNWRKFRHGKDVVIIVHHPTRKYKALWDKKNHAEIEKQLDFFLRNNIGIDVTIIEMETQCVNEIEVDEAA